MVAIGMRGLAWGGRSMVAINVVVLGRVMVAGEAIAWGGGAVCDMGITLDSAEYFPCSVASSREHRSMQAYEGFGIEKV